MLATDWLAAGPLIVARLRETVPALRLVTTMTDLTGAAIDERVQSQVPAAVVAYLGDRYDAGPRSGMAQQGAQRWCVVLAVRNARSGGDNTALGGEAGPLLPQIGAALAGWTPIAGGRPLRRVTALAPGYGTAFAYYPLMFELDFVTATPGR